MTWDAEVFGGGSAPAYDKDIFKESTPAPTMEGPVGPPDNRNWLARMVGVSPATYERNIAAMENQRLHGWGAGYQPAAEALGTRIGEATNSPNFGSALGTTLGFLPDAIQMAIGGEVAKGAAPALDWAGKSLMSSALKPGVIAERKGKAGPAVETLLEEGINVTAGGLEKARRIIGDLSDQVSEKIANSGAMVNVRKVADYANDAYQKFAKGPQAVSAVDDIGKAQVGLLTHPEVAGAREIPVQLANEMKGGYQKAVGDKGYGELKTAATEAEKAIARGFRTEIGQAVPSVLVPLSREAALINALKLAEHRVAVDAGKNPLGLGALVANPLAIPYWLWDRSALGKSLAARLLYSGQETLPALAGQGITGAALYRPEQ